LRPAGDEDVLAVEIVFDILGVEVLVAAHVHARDVTLGASVASEEGAFTDQMKIGILSGGPRRWWLARRQLLIGATRQPDFPRVDQSVVRIL
jgi:hypothetical protein